MDAWKGSAVTNGFKVERGSRTSSQPSYAQKTSSPVPSCRARVRALRSMSATNVVGQCDPPHAGRRGNLHNIVIRAVPPGFLWAVLLGRVLGVVDHEVGVGHKFGVPAVSFVQDGLDTARLGTGAPKLIGERLVVYQVHHRHA